MAHLSVGWVGSSGFWALSGFVFWVSYGRRGLTAKTFWVHRFARLYPLHFVTLIVTAGLQIISWRQTGAWTVYGNDDLPHFGLHLIMASNWFGMESSFNAPIWSVSVEVLIYGAFVLFMLRPSVVLALSVAAFSFIVYHITLNQIPFCSALFFTGVVLSMLAPGLQSNLKDWSLPAVLAALMAIAGIVALFARAGYWSKALTVAAFVMPPALVLAFVAIDYRLNLPSRWHWVGLITYSVYLLHMPILIGFRLAGVYPPLWLFCATVISLSLLSYRYIEAPAQRWIRALSKRPKIEHE